jgi:hypothetical protein
MAIAGGVTLTELLQLLRQPELGGISTIASLLSVFVGLISLTRDLTGTTISAASLRTGCSRAAIAAAAFGVGVVAILVLFKWAVEWVVKLAIDLANLTPVTQSEYSLYSAQYAAVLGLVGGMVLASVVVGVIRLLSQLTNKKGAG